MAAWEQRKVSWKPGAVQEPLCKPSSASVFPLESPGTILVKIISAQFTNTGYHELFAASYHPYLCPGWAVARIPKSSSVPGCSGCVQRQLQGHVSTTTSGSCCQTLWTSVPNSLLCGVKTAWGAQGPSGQGHVSPCRWFPDSGVSQDFRIPPSCLETPGLAHF